MSYALSDKGSFQGFENLAPIVPASYMRGNNSLGPVSAEVDTGAAISVAPSTLARQLGINLESGELVSLRGVGGSVDSYVHPVDVGIGDQVFHGIPVAITTKDDSPFLLGRLGFLQEADLSFNQGQVSVRSSERGMSVMQVEPATDPRKALIAVGIFVLALGGYFALSR